MGLVDRLLGRSSPSRFLQQSRAAVAQPAVPVPIWWAGNDVDFNASEEDMARLFAHVQQTWTQLGAEQPHWSVLSLEAYLKDNLDTNLEKFFASGEAELAAIQVAFQRTGRDLSSVKSILEYGCGVGRVTAWLGRQFAAVHAVDISHNHLKLAEQTAASARLANVAFHHVQTLDDVAALPKVDLAYSMIVLQHNPPPIILAIVRRLLGCVNPGGYLFLQVPGYIPGYRFSVPDFLAHGLSNRDMEMHVVPQHAMVALLQEAGCRIVEVIHDECGGPSIGSLTYFVQTRT
jgi:2-polyprenyl-3-methyl-5-hydroxy-6-metoxy-1,4-benzoquinol methylase